MNDLVTPKFKPYVRNTIQNSTQWKHIPKDLQDGIMVVSQVLPFRVNQYVMDELIDWDNIPNDPIYRLTFPHQDMLSKQDFGQLYDLMYVKKDEAAMNRMVTALRLQMNPHPAGQMTHNVPTLDGVKLHGLQHKYKETVLFFPSAGQTCHAYCTFCFRWPQFVGMEDFKFNAKETGELVAYLKQHPEVTDVLITGGDPLVMNTRSLAGYIEPLLELEQLQNIRIGTKSLAYWPGRFLTDKDADDLLMLFEKVVKRGKNMAIMGHYNHPIEISTPLAQQAVKRVLGTGATIRLQSPLIRHINDDAKAWAELWTKGVRLGAIPYYMFVERDTGPRHYFEVPLVKAYEIFQSAYQSVSGLSRTVRGPSMSAFPGKVLVDGVATINNEKVFVLQLLQARDPSLVRKPFFAKFDPKAVWLDDLVPAFGEKKFFFEKENPLEKSDINPSAKLDGPQPINFVTKSKLRPDAEDELDVVGARICLTEYKG